MNDTMETSTSEDEITIESLCAEIKNFGDNISTRLKKLTEIRKRLGKTSTQSKTKVRRKKAKGEPKGVKTAFIFYVGSRREALAKETTITTDIFKICGKEWNNLTDEEQGPFQLQASSDSTRHKVEMEKFLADCSAVEEENKTKT